MRCVPRNIKRSGSHTSRFGDARTLPTRRRGAVWALVIVLSAVLPIMENQIAAAETCPPTPGVAPADDVTRGNCLFHSRTAFGQDPQGPFANCATCHYGTQTTDRGSHLIQITNKAGRTTEVIRRTPSLLNAAVNFPYGWDGRFATIQDAAQHAILSPVEMNGKSVSSDQLDSLTAYVLTLGPAVPPPPPPTSATVAAAIARGQVLFNGKAQCATCHTPPTFTSNQVTTDQINANFSGTTDPGAAFVGTGGFANFKVPSLNHFASLAPFMHDGALAKTDQLVLFYNKSLGLGLTSGEMSDLIYYLESH
jgi:cytochrome c peroxidase